MPGVVAIVTGADLVAAGVKPLVQSADFKRADGSKTAAPPQHALAVDTVRFVGEAVAAIVAETPRPGARRGRGDRRRLRAAAERRRRRRCAERRARRWCGRPRPATSRARRGTAMLGADRRRVREGGARRDARSRQPALRARADRAARDARELRRGDRSHHAARRAARRRPGLRDELCSEVLGIPPESVRVVVGDVGGGFGMKTTLYAEDVLAAYCARKLERPVKWTAERLEEFLSASQGRDVNSKAELALDANGRILALRVSSRANLGAYATPAGVVIQLLIGPWVSTSVYDIQTIDVHIRGVLTNTTPTGPVPRRRASRGDLPDRAADGRGGAADRHRSRSSCVAATSSGPSRCRTRTRWTRPTTAASSRR